MANKYYECHLTLRAAPDEKAYIKDLVERLGWKFSAIEGDIVMGAGVKYYATRHFNFRNTEETVLGYLHTTGDTLHDRGVGVERRKVELVAYDDRSSKVKPEACNGGCIGCHLDDLKTE